MTPPLTINTIPAEHGAVEHQLVDAVGWIHAKLWNCSEADAAAVKSALEGRPTPAPLFDVPARLDPPSPDLAGDLQAVGYVEGWNGCQDLMAKAAEHATLRSRCSGPEAIGAIDEAACARAEHARAKAMEREADRIGAMRAAITAAGIWRPDFGMQSRSDAWERVAKTLSEVSPNWINSRNGMSGIDCAVAEIERLAKASEAAAAGAPEGWRFVPVADHIQIRLPNSEGFCEVMPSDGIIFRLAQAMVDAAAKPGSAAVNPQMTAAQHVRADLVPGVMRCAKCNFQVHRVVLYMGNGAVGAGDSKTEPCPNGCGPLWPVTWAQWATEAHEYAERLQSELATMKAAQPNVVKRTDQEIVRQTEELAALFMLEIYSREAVDAGYIFRDASDPRGKHCWQLACRAQEMLTDTDPENAVSESAYIEAKPTPGEPFDYGSLTIPAAAREALARQCGSDGIPINQADEE
ncbi:MAG: hypothetical protein ACRC6L_09895 [Steroidobacteraceae bacterium]